MTIKSIRIKNCLSIKSAEIELSNISCFIGENGVGKSTIYKVIQYFYNALANEKAFCDLHDKLNPFNDTISITINYDFSFYNNWLEGNFLSRRETSYYNELMDLKQHVKNDILSVTLNHSKKFNTIRWSNGITYKQRNFIKNLYPYYLIETRNLNLHDWRQLWEMVAELSIFPTEMDEISKKLDDQGEKHSHIFDILNKTFKDQDVKISEANIKEQFSAVMKLKLKGDRPYYKNKQLDYYSDGLNSYNYLKLFLQLVSQISEFRNTKYPTILIDEPEIGLHPKLIDHLVDYLGVSSKTNIWINTHSPRLVKNIISKKESYILYHVSLKKEYTMFRKMTKPSDDREISRISEKEASFYFASGLVLVEGETEIELFNNYHLQKLFPFLKNIDIYSFDGDDSLKQEIVNPDRKNLNIPYMLLVDGDKIFHFRDKKLIFNKRKEHISPFTNRKIKKKEYLYFGKKREYTLARRIEIEHLISTTELIENERGFPIGIEGIYDELMDLIKKYHISYRVYPLKNTVEGLMISNYNYEKFTKWYSSQYNIDSNKLDSILTHSDVTKLKVTLLRLLVKGKYDSLTSEDYFKKNIYPNLENDSKNIYKDIEGHRIKNKTGWITTWINHFFENYIEIHKDKQTQLHVFKSNFNELYDIIKHIEILTFRE